MEPNESIWFIICTGFLCFTDCWCDEACWGALNLSVLRKELEARFLMCVMSLSYFCWLLCDDHGPEVERITWKGAFKFLQAQSSFSCCYQKVMVWLLSSKTWGSCGL